MRNDRRVIAAICYIVLGAVLLVLGMMEMVDEFWSGMGGALVVMGVLRMVQFFRYRNNEEYREKAEIAAKDERNHYIRNKAWAWSGYLFVLIAAVATIAFQNCGTGNPQLRRIYGHLPAVGAVLGVVLGVE